VHAASSYKMRGFVNPGCGRHALSPHLYLRPRRPGAAASRSVVEDFAKADPYVTFGLVTRWVVREWTTVLGRDAAHALPPGV